MKTASRIIEALAAGARTADQLGGMLGQSTWSVYASAEKQVARGALTVTKMATRRRSGRPTNLYSLECGGAIDLGQVDQVQAYNIAHVVGALMYQNGEVALFIGATGRAAAAVYGTPGYDAAVSTHGSNLVGVYRSRDDRSFIPHEVVDDVLARLAELPPKEQQHAA